jgi:hypothetical protein
MADAQCKTINTIRHLLTCIGASKTKHPSEGRENPPYKITKQTQFDAFVAFLQKRTEEARESLSSHGRHCEERTISTENRLFQLEREAANTHRELADIHSLRANPNQIWLKAVQQSAKRTTDYEPDQPLARREEAPPAQQAPEACLNPAVNESLGQLHDLRSHVEGDWSVLNQDYVRGAGSTNLRAMPMSLVWQTISQGWREASVQEVRPSSRAPAANRAIHSLSWDSPQDSQSDNTLDGKEPIEATNMEDPEMGPESNGPHVGDAYNNEYDENPCSKGSDRATRLDEDDQDFDPDEPQCDDDKGGDYNPGDAQYDNADQDFDSDNLQYDEGDQDYHTDDAPYYKDNENSKEENSDHNEFGEYAAPLDESDQDGD